MYPDVAGAEAEGKLAKLGGREFGGARKGRKGGAL